MLVQSPYLVGQIASVSDWLAPGLRARGEGIADKIVPTAAAGGRLANTPITYRDFSEGVMRLSQSNRHSRKNGSYSNHPNNRSPHHRTQTFDSTGPNVKIRGRAGQMFERYAALAREAAASGDRIAAENLYQHAEHYLHIMNAERQNPNAATADDPGGD
jgi:hypothetical protein